MKGFKHSFIRECKKYGIAIQVGKLWQCRWDKIIVPEQDTHQNIFYGFHELAHAVLHKDDARDYDDLKQRIDIELEADRWAYERMKHYGYLDYSINNATLGLIAL